MKAYCKLQSRLLASVTALCLSLCSWSVLAGEHEDGAKPPVGGGRAMVVDPAWQVDTILKAAEARDYKIVGALISHHHYDHTNGIEELLKNTDCKVYIHKNDAEFVNVGGWEQLMSSRRSTGNGGISPAEAIVTRAGNYNIAVVTIAMIVVRVIVRDDVDIARPNGVRQQPRLRST